MGGRGWRPGSVPPQGQVQGLLGKQRLDQGQVQARNTAAIQHQDLIAGTQTWENKGTLQRLWREHRRCGFISTSGHLH